jgi:hypothetical protein
VEFISTVQNRIASGLIVVSGVASRPGFTPGEGAPGTHWVGRWVGPRAGLADVEQEKIVDPIGTRTSTP